MDLIANAIARHGAKRVYDAAVARMQGEPALLATVGIIANNLAEADAIMSAA